MRQTNPAPHFPTQGIIKKSAWTVILGCRDHFPQVKYNNAVDQLERTSEKLQTAKVKCVEARQAAAAAVSGGQSRNQFFSIPN